MDLNLKKNPRDPLSASSSLGFLRMTFACQRAFTLMEILVSMSIFAIFVLLSLSIYSSVLRNYQKSLVNNKVQQEAQLVMSSLAKKIRTSRVNYDYVGYSDGIEEKEDELSLIDLSGYEFVFFLEDNNLKVKTKAPDSPDYSAGQSIPALNVSVDSVSFVIEPKTFPFDINIPPSSQPRVTVVLSFSSSKAGQSSVLTVQQTAPQLSGGIVP